jgi:hypothetical protein
MARGGRYGTPGGYDPGGDDDSGSSSSGSAGGGLAGGGGDSFTGDPGEFDDDDDDGGSSSGSAGGGLDSGAGDTFTGDPDTVTDDPTTPAGPGLDPGTGGSTRPEPQRTTIEAGGERVDIPDVGVGSGPTPSEFGQIDEASLRQRGETYSEEVGDPIGAAVRRSSPVTEVDRALPGEPVGRSVQGITEGLVSLGNAPAAAAGAIAATDRAVRDTRRANEEGAAGRRQNRRELASDAIGAATATGAAIQRDPVGTLSRLGGAAVGGAFVGGAASRALRGTPDAPDAPDTPDGTVLSGRSDVGTGGADSLLDDVDVDAERGITGPSTRSRVSGEVSRAVDDATARLGDSRLGDFVEDTRAQLQQPRSREPDLGDAPDRTRPADAGGTFEDVRQDALTQLQDDLGGRGRRPNPGTFDDAPDPFRSGGGDTIDADGVQLQRTTGTPDTGGQTAGLGDLSAVNDPSQIATGLGIASGTGIRLDPRNDPTGVAADSAADERGDGVGLGLGGSGTGAGSFGIRGVNDQSGVAPDDDAGTTGGLDSGTDTVTDTGTIGLGDGDTGTEPIPQLRASTTLGTRPATDATTRPATRTGTLADPETATDVGADGFGTGGGFGLGGTGTPPRRREEEGDEQPDDEPLPFGLATDADTLDSRIASGGELLGDITDGFDRDGPFSV